ncbi:putative Plant invertase/pectin methylesterase inhibitor superfamily protein [Hibiscus syriacus]|uniref:Plant invertase/pectin methylesterase inhibitor superfamily protein n=1 Tax=Hibiscus syriacus TaxID=106335 RepID=A0A6A2XU55_HIBSY|nr:uncharacterized protein LOC120175103 [Hibiscus syriacus]KAE8670355.1 putative Plant invertase/pectin methylesterase inhibitor superfamily protein [Hibiscus syriacus]
MDPRDKALEFDLENGVAVNGRGDFVVPLLSGDVSGCGSVYVDNLQAMRSSNCDKDGKENRLVLKEKRKPPKPPRPPRPLSLDAADQKLIKEIAELARLKRARIERIKALKKMKAAEGTTSHGNNVLATVFTVIFCIVVIFQGMSTGGRPTSNEESPVPAGAGALNRGLISVQFSEKPSAIIPNQPVSGSP